MQEKNDTLERLAEIHSPLRAFADDVIATIGDTVNFETEGNYSECQVGTNRSGRKRISFSWDDEAEGNKAEKSFLNIYLYSNGTVSIQDNHQQPLDVSFDEVFSGILQATDALRKQGFPINHPFNGIALTPEQEEVIAALTSIEETNAIAARIAEEKSRAIAAEEEAKDAKEAAKEEALHAAILLPGEFKDFREFLEKGVKLDPQEIDALSDPITLEIPEREQAVMTPSGMTFSRDFIVGHIEENGTDPMTGDPLTVEDLTVNPRLEKLYEAYDTRKKISAAASVTRTTRLAGVLNRNHGDILPKEILQHIGALADSDRRLSNEELARSTEEGLKTPESMETAKEATKKGFMERVLDRYQSEKSSGISK